DVNSLQLLRLTLYFLIEIGRIDAISLFQATDLNMCPQIFTTKSNTEIENYRSNDWVQNSKLPESHEKKLVKDA
ncbi:hypothetical protein GcC1_028005, partial [Golovinomyces cichoracearum]